MDCLELQNYSRPNPSNPAVVSDIDGKVVYGKIKRGIREIKVVSKNNEMAYKIPYGKHILVHDDDQIFAGEKYVKDQYLLKIF